MRAYWHSRSEKNIKIHRYKPKKPTLYNFFDFCRWTTTCECTSYWKWFHKNWERFFQSFFVTSPKLITIDISMDYGFMLRFMLNITNETKSQQTKKKFVSVVVDISCFQGFIIYQFVKLGWKMIKTIKRRCSRNRNF